MDVCHMFGKHGDPETLDFFSNYSLDNHAEWDFMPNCNRQKSLSRIPVED